MIYSHVRNDKDVFEAAEEAVDVGFAILIVLRVKHKH